MIIFLVLGFLGIPLVAGIASLQMGIPIAIYLDILSFIISPLSPFLIVLGIYRTFNINQEGYILFGNLAVGFGFTGTFIGWIIMCYNFSLENNNELSDALMSFSVSLLPILYGFMAKYLIALPMVAFKQK